MRAGATKPRQTSSLSRLRQLRAQSPRIKPGNVLVVYRVNDPDSVAIAQYYQSARGIPEANMLGVSFTWTYGAVLTETECNANLLPYLAEKVSSLKIGAVLTCGRWPLYVSTGAIPLATVLGASRMVAARAVNVRYQNASYPRYTTYLNEYDKVSDLIPLPLANTGCNQTRPIGMLVDFGGADTQVPHFRLETGPIETTDTRRSSQVDYCRRIIDDCIYAEQARYNDLGTVLLSGSGSYSTDQTQYGNGLAVALPAYHELVGLAPGKYYWRGLRNEPTSIFRGFNHYNTGAHIASNYLHTPLQPVGATAATAPAFSTTPGSLTVDGAQTWLCRTPVPADNFPAGQTDIDYIAPEAGLTFSPINDVFIRCIGLYSYYGNQRKPEPQSAFAYRKGAVVLFSQSYGFSPGPHIGKDWYFGNADALTTYGANGTATDCLVDYSGYLSFANIIGNLSNPMVLKCNNAVTTATRVFTGTNTLVLTENGATVATLNWTSKTLDQVFDYLVANLPAGWLVKTLSGGTESRAMNALKNGAALVMASHREPYTNGAIKGRHFFSSLWFGSNAAEASLVMLQDTQAQGAYTMIIGDPLYKPFGHREK